MAVYQCSHISCNARFAIPTEEANRYWGGRSGIMEVVVFKVLKKLMIRKAER